MPHYWVASKGKLRTGCSEDVIHRDQRADDVECSVSNDEITLVLPIVYVEDTG